MIKTFITELFYRLFPKLDKRPPRPLSVLLSL